MMHILYLLQLRYVRHICMTSLPVMLVGPWSLYECLFISNACNFDYTPVHDKVAWSGKTET